ncbi:MAG TPA: DUF5946 family protein [Roseiflexaceae bacterium]|nr:DUF5946 family protein [Roseiflexaceae bacterium]
MSEPTQAHPPYCPECGAPRVNGLTCWEMLGTVIAWEYDDADLRAEHFLTVASYNLQLQGQHGCLSQNQSASRCCASGR